MNAHIFVITPAGMWVELDSAECTSGTHYVQVVQLRVGMQLYTMSSSIPISPLQSCNLEMIESNFSGINIFLKWRIWTLTGGSMLDSFELNWHNITNEGGIIDEINSKLR